MSLLTTRAFLQPNSTTSTLPRLFPVVYARQETKADHMDFGPSHGHAHQRGLPHVAAGVEGAAWTLVWALVIGSAIGVYYYLRVVFAVTKRDAPDAVDVQPVWESVAAAAALGVVIVVLGVYVQPLVEFLRQHSWQPW